jgi:hypothetical protein
MSGIFVFTGGKSMDLILIVGSGAVGKMTVGQELMKITDFRLFHNHMMIEPVIEIFGRFNGALVNKLRDDIFEEFMKTNYQGMIFTYMWAFDMQWDWDYVNSLKEKFEANVIVFLMMPLQLMLQLYSQDI